VSAGGPWEAARAARCVLSDERPPAAGNSRNGYAQPVDVRCEVWWARPSDARPWHAGVLSGAERRRRATLERRVDRDRFSVACTVARLVLAERLSIAPSAVPLDEITGAPRLRAGRTGPWVSVAHAGTRVAIAICHDVPIGVEIAPMRDRVDLDEIARIALSPAESTRIGLLDPNVQAGALLALWTRKSAVLKATGTPLSVSPALVAAAGDRAIVPGEPRPASVVGLHPGPGHVAALAVIGAPPVEVVERDAGPRLTGGRAPASGELPGPDRALA
jgi:4'-phosphopantetheinyl transferase